MTQDPFPRSALEANRAGRLTPEQIRSLHVDAGESKRTGLLAGIAIAAVGLFILWGTFTGRAPGSRLQSLGIGAALAAVGALILSRGGMTRGPRASQAVSESTRLDMIEGPFRREQYDSTVLGGHSYATRGSARYDYYLYVGARRLSVSEAAYGAAPDDGIVRVYLLPGSDRVVNLERIAEAPPTAIETRARDLLQERFGPTEAEQPSPSTATTAAELRAMLIGRWEAQGMPVTLEFRADGTVIDGEGESKRWEVLDTERVSIDGEAQQVRIDGDHFSLVTRGPTLRFRRSPR